MNIRKKWLEGSFWRIAVSVLVAVVWVAGTSLYGAETVEKKSLPVAAESFSSYGLSWEPSVDYSSLELSVAGPDGEVFKKSFKAGVSPHLDLSELLKGKRITDGSYTYELRVVPVGVKKERTGTEGNLSLDAGLVQSGYFYVQKGAIVSSKTPEMQFDNSLDQVINDDLIVTFSACIGSDCTNGYSFGFDTLVLKENNLRMFFDDTSTSGSFPKNDWRLIANDSSNGGAEYFAIEDSTAGRKVFTVSAGAPANSLYVDSQGDVGVGTSTPAVNIHAVDGNTPTLRLEQNGSSGFTPQTWDIAGNETNFFVRDVTNGSKLPFRIKPNAPKDSIFIDSNGDLGIGTDNPAVTMELQTTGEWATFYLQRTDGATAQIAGGDSDVWIGSQTNHPVKFSVNDSAKMIIDTDGDVGIGLLNPTHKLEIVGGAYCDGGQWVAGSSRTLKENIRDLTANEAIETLEALNPVRYNYKLNKQEEYLGFIAEDVPDLVAMKDRKGMASMDVVAILTKVVQQQQKIISTLNARLSQLEKEKK